MPANGDFIPDNICYSCGALTDIEINENVQYIGDSAFRSCASLKTVIFHSFSLNSIWTYAFQGCTSLEVINLPEGLTELGAYVFRDCPSLASISIPSTLTHCGDRPFWNNPNIKNLYLTDLSAFCHITYDTETWNSSTVIPNHIYLNGELLTKVVIPDTVTKIPCNAFNSDDITEIVIPDSVVLFRGNSFRWDNLSTIYFGGSEEEWAILYNAAGTPATSATIVFNYSGT
ncbi:MAG: leucine-rich repeat protein [Clostridia bacterium]|nr:leucine-rich repeat protein [Clostridia bacterium]